MKAAETRKEGREREANKETGGDDTGSGADVDNSALNDIHTELGRRGEDLSLHPVHIRCSNPRISAVETRPYKH
jgi:hypothetical protein